MLWLLTGVTAVVLLVIGLLVREIAKKPTAAGSAALSGPARAAVSRSPHPRASPRSAPVPHPRVTDAASGLSYRLLSRPWRHGCPSTLNSPAFNWTAGENAVAGQVSIGGSVVDWHGLACSGVLQPEFAYSGPAGLESTAASLVAALDPAYYAGVQHYRTLRGSAATVVGGHPAWVLSFAMTYPEGASQGLTWTSELGAVVLVDRGVAGAPAVFYVSVPANLGTRDVSVLLQSLRSSS
jgi:hypothetical protein